MVWSGLRGLVCREVTLDVWASVSHVTRPRPVCLQLALSGVITTTSVRHMRSPLLSAFIEVTIWLFKLWADRLGRTVTVGSVERPEI